MLVHLYANVTTCFHMKCFLNHDDICLILILQISYYIYMLQVRACTGIDIEDHETHNNCSSL